MSILRFHCARLSRESIVDLSPRRKLHRDDCCTRIGRGSIAFSNEFVDRVWWHCPPGNDCRRSPGGWSPLGGTPRTLSAHSVRSIMSVTSGIAEIALRRGRLSSACNLHTSRTAPRIERTPCTFIFAKCHTYYSTTGARPAVETKARVVQMSIKKRPCPVVCGSGNDDSEICCTSAIQYNHFASALIIRIDRVHLFSVGSHCVDFAFVAV